MSVVRIRISDKTLASIQIGDYVIVNSKNAKRAKLLKDAKLRIISIERDDPTIMVGEFNGVKYEIFAENIAEVFRSYTFVLS